MVFSFIAMRLMIVLPDLVEAALQLFGELRVAVGDARPDVADDAAQPLPVPRQLQLVTSINPSDPDGVDLEVEAAAVVAGDDLVDDGLEGALQVLLAHQLDVRLHRLRRDRVAPAEGRSFSDSNGRYRGNLSSLATRD